MEHPGFSLSVLLRYLVLPALVLGLLSLWCGRMGRSWGLAPSRPGRVLWGLIATFWVVYGLMGSLSYLTYRTTIQDLGVYDQRIWVLSVTEGFPSPARVIATFGHFSPILAVHVLLYKLYPSAIVLICTQALAVGLGAYPVYQLAKRHLGQAPAVVFAAAYLLYPSVIFTVLFDFHPDHLLIPLLLFAFYFLEQGHGWALAAVAASALLIKESLVPSILAFGAYAVVVRRRYLLGVSVVLGGAAVFAFVIVRIYASVFGAGTAGAGSYGYLGSDLATILRTVVLSPGTWLPELTQVPKLKFLFLMLAPLAFLPVFGPSALLVAVPGLLMSLLSQHPHRYQIWAQYTAPIIAPLFVAAILGCSRLASYAPVRRLLPWATPRVLLSVWLLGTSVYFNVVFSPSPVSTAFWLGKPERLRWPYHLSAYLITDREREIRRALDRYVPSDPKVSVSSQNNINSSHLAHRFKFVQFPADGDFIVVDLRRPRYLYDGIDPVAFSRDVDHLKRKRQILYEADGFFIFGPSPA